MRGSGKGVPLRRKGVNTGQKIIRISFTRNGIKQMSILDFLRDGQNRSDFGCKLEILPKN